MKYRCSKPQAVRYFPFSVVFSPCWFGFQSLSQDTLLFSTATLAFEKRTDFTDDYFL